MRKIKFYEKRNAYVLTFLLHLELTFSFRIYFYNSPKFFLKLLGTHNLKLYSKARVNILKMCFEYVGQADFQTNSKEIFAAPSIKSRFPTKIS